MKEKTFKILIMKFRNIGDVLLITPVIQNLKFHYPNAKIDVALNEETKEMITLNPNVNEILSYDRAAIKSQNIIKQLFSEIQFALHIRKKNYDIIINTTRGDRGAILSLISGAKLKIGYNSKNIFLKNVFKKQLPRYMYNHMVDANLDILRILNLPILEKKVQIYTSKKDEENINQLLNKLKIEEKSFIHIHAVSRWMFKCINDHTMAKIIDYCQIHLKKKIILTTAPIKHEINKVNSIIKLCQTQPISLAGKLSLKQTAVLNKKAYCFIGVDTAIMHISAANNIPTFAFFGPSQAYHWAPWDNNLMKSNYINIKGGIQQMGMHTIYQEERECLPCNKDGCNGSKKSDCLLNIDFNKVMHTIELFLEKNFKSH